MKSYISVKKTIMLRLKQLSILLFLMVLSIRLLGQYKADVSVDPRVELLSITFRLAGNQEYSDTYAKKYVEDIHAWFDPYQSDSLIGFAKRMRMEHGVSYDAVMSMAVHLKIDGKKISLLKESENTLERRWTKENANEFVKLLNAFYTKTKANEFFAKHQELYADAVVKMQEAFKDFDPTWYATYYGNKPTEAYKVIIGLGNGGGNYGPHVMPLNKQKIVYAVMGCWKFDDAGKPVFETGRYLPTLIHEFNHSFVNHHLDEGDNTQKLTESGKAIYATVSKEMQSQAYAEWKTMINESVVRASVVRYMIDHHAATADVNKEIAEQQGRSFLWTPGLVSLLGTYERSRKIYPDFAAFYPQIISFFDQTSTNIDSLKIDYSAKQPKVKSLSPFVNGAQDVNPATTEIVILFDRPLFGKGYSINAGTLGNSAIPIKKLMGYEQDNQAFRVGVELKPNTAYEFVLTGLSFKSTTGIPIENYTIRFKTAAQ
ncbi:MAG: DUF4932 domain-containing protein [Pedobacter sp.]|nr:MAG: DUF4932 domain-containing protein [Pedobacter sp.]